MIIFHFFFSQMLLLFFYSISIYAWYFYGIIYVSDI